MIWFFIGLAVGIYSTKLFYGFIWGSVRRMVLGDDKRKRK